MNNLANYFYLVNHHGVLGWCASSDHAIDIIRDHYPAITDQELQSFTYVVKIAYKYGFNPLSEGTRTLVMPSSDGGIHTEDGCRDNPEGTLACIAPMLYKGLSANLATVYIGSEAVHLVRRSEEEALSEDAYIALLHADYDHYIAGAPAIRRANAPARIRHESYPIRYILEYPDGRRRDIDDVSLRCISRLGLPLTADQREFISLLERIRSNAYLGVATYPRLTVWQHIRTGSYQMGKYPVTYGHGRDFKPVGCLLSGIVSGRRGGVAQFYIGEDTYKIIGVEV